MNELKQPSKEHQKLLQEWVRQYNSGEHAAKYWAWFHGAAPLFSNPQFTEGVEYRFEPSQRHPHYSIFSEWKMLKATEKVERGKYELFWRPVSRSNPNKWSATYAPSWSVTNSYKIEKTAKHPDNCKPKLKILDWANAPVGTMTDLGVVIRVAKGLTYDTALVVDFDNYLIRDIRVDKLRTIPATDWTAVQDGENPPVCDGLVIEYRYTRTAYEGGGWCIKSYNTPIPLKEGINAYRVTGIAKGYTDVPEEGGHNDKH